jgi:hypothetical protein
MSSRACPLALVLALGCLLVPASAAWGNAGDTAATQAYVQANLKLVQVARSHLASSEAAPLQIVLPRVRRECPLAAAPAPQNPESTHLSYEVIGAMVVASYRPDLAAMRAYVRAVEPLRWSNSGLTNKLHGYARKLQTLSTLTAPDICADIRAWGKSNYLHLPSSTIHFDELFEPAWVALGELPGSLTAYANTATKALIRRTDPLEQLLIEGEARAAESYEQVMDELELKP